MLGSEETFQGRGGIWTEVLMQRTFGKVVQDFDFWDNCYCKKVPC